MQIPPKCLELFSEILQNLNIFGRISKVIQNARKKPAPRRGPLGTYTPLVLFSVDNPTPSMVTSTKKKILTTWKITSGEYKENVMSRQFQTNGSAPATANLPATLSPLLYREGTRY
jgi:hypothetical protein